MDTVVLFPTHATTTTLFPSLLFPTSPPLPSTHTLPLPSHLSHLTLFLFPHLSHSPLCIYINKHQRIISNTRHYTPTFSLSLLCPASSSLLTLQFPPLLSTSLLFYPFFSF